MQRERLPGSTLAIPRGHAGALGFGVWKFPVRKDSLAVRASDFSAGLPGPQLPSSTCVGRLCRCSTDHLPLTPKPMLQLSPWSPLHPRVYACGSRPQGQPFASSCELLLLPHLSSPGGRAQINKNNINTIVAVKFHLI